MLQISCRQIRCIHQTNKPLIQQSVRYIFGLGKKQSNNVPANPADNHPTNTTENNPYEELFIKFTGASSKAMKKKSQFVVERSEDHLHTESVQGQVQDKLDYDRIKVRLAEIEKEKRENNPSTDHSPSHSHTHVENQPNQSFDQTTQQTLNQSSQSPLEPTVNQQHRHSAKQQEHQRAQSKIGVPEIIQDHVQLDIHAKNPELISRMNRLMVGSSISRNDHEFLNPAVNQSDRVGDSQSNQIDIQSSNQSTSPPLLKTKYKPSVRTAQVDEVTVRKGSLTQLQLMRILALTETVNPSTGQKFDSKFLSQKFHVDQHLIDRLMNHVAVPRLFIPDRNMNQPDESGRIGVWPHRSIHQSSKHEPPPVYVGGSIMGEHLIDHLVKLRR